jgi:putative membrane protein
VYIRNYIHWRLIWHYSWRDVLLFTAYDVALVVLYGPLQFRWLDVPWQLVSIVGVAVSFYVGFKNKESYSRFWEARGLWGGISHTSRSWAAQVLTTTGLASQQGTAPPAVIRPVPLLTRRLVYRQLAWCNALRLGLRRQPARWDAEVAPFLEPAESERVRYLTNPAAQLLLAQTADLMLMPPLVKDFQHASLLDILREATRLQVGCERIKDTPFPRQYAFSSLVFVWLFVLLLPLGMLSEFGRLGHGHFWLAVPFSILVSWVFVTIELVGHISEDPFEHRMNDVPMSALCRALEIDLRQMLRETDVPTPLDAEQGILY